MVISMLKQIMHLYCEGDGMHAKDDSEASVGSCILATKAGACEICRQDTLCFLFAALNYPLRLILNVL